MAMLGHTRSQLGQMRSTNHADYQNVARPIAAMAKEFVDRAETGEHSHPRGQLLHAIDGVMLARAAGGAWLVPPGHALCIPPGVRHNVAMRGAVAMRTIYLRSEASGALGPSCRVIQVSALLREAILALTEEDILYDEAGRGGHLAALIVDEIARAATTRFDLPMPKDRRLVAICDAMIAEPALERNIDGWAEQAGLSRRALTRGFRGETGLSFGAWRRRLRTLTALSRIESGEPVAVTAHRVGYKSPSALTAMIRREMG